MSIRLSIYKENLMSEIEEYNFCWDDYYQSLIDQREQLQEQILTVLDNISIHPSNDKLKSKLCQVVCDHFFEEHGV